MTIVQLEYILAVDKFRHFNKAAKHCNITQPTLSMQLQKAEEEMGIVIFDRSKNPIIPTDDGLKIIEQARSVIREYQKIFAIASGSKNEICGTFRLGIIPSMSPYVLPLFALSFVKKYPEVNLIIEELKTEEIINKLHKDEIDAGILATPLPDENFIERVLFNEPFLVYASKEHDLLKKNKLKGKELDTSDLWILNEGHCFRQQVLNICHVKKENKGHLKFESGSLETLKNMVKKTSGYTLLPLLAVLNLNKEDKSQVREFNIPIPSREVSLVHNRIYLKEKIINAIEQVIIENLPSEIRSLKSKNLDTIQIN